jgi:hypothetical protein
MYPEQHKLGISSERAEDQTSSITGLSVIERIKLQEKITRDKRM